MTCIENVWKRIELHEGQTFCQLRGGEFTYRMSGRSIKLDRTNQNIPMVHFERALEAVPLENTTQVQHLRGPSYIFAILMDPRIRAGEW